MTTSPYRARPPRSPRANTVANGSSSTHSGSTGNVDSSSSGGDKQVAVAGFRRLQDENALLHKKIDLLRKKVQSMSAATEQSQHAHLHLSPRGITPPPAAASLAVAQNSSSGSDEMKNMFLGIISSLRSTIEAQDATINGQDLLIKALTTSS